MALTKDQELMLANEKNFNKVKAEKIKKAQEAGIDFNNLQIPDNFDFQALTGDYFLKRCPQEVAAPITNEQAQTLMRMKKMMIGQPYTKPSKTGGKLIHGAYFVSRTEPRYLFAVSIVTPEKGDDKFFDYNVKLDVCLSGKQWLPLARFDSLGPAHPNYVQNGKVVEKVDVPNAETPHLHTYDEYTQIVCDDLEYSLANEVDRSLYNMKDAKNPQYFKAGIQSFFNMFGVDAIINKEVESDYKYNYNQPLFDWANYKYITSKKDLEGMN